jgi:hypothetical protein
LKKMLGAVLLLAATAHASEPPAAAVARIDPAGLSARVRFLSDDLLEGRASAERGYEIASAYVAAELAALGVEPAGADGTWFQPVPLVRTRAGDKATVTLSLRGKARELERDSWVLAASPGAQALDVDAEVVFAGYGIVAPRSGHDDYRGIDVRGKVVAVLPQAPTTLPADERAHHGSQSVKKQVAASRGAIGIVHLLSVGPDAGYWKMMARVAEQGVVDSLPPPGQAPNAQFGMALTAAGSAALLEGSGRTMEQLRTKPQPGLKFPTRLQVKAQVRHEALSSRNVAGVLKGSDPRLAGEFVVVSAHLDHLGLVAHGEDRVNNGAVDNASGVAGLIEMAEAFAAAPRRPLRSVLFLAVAAEELGLLGSEYFAENPTVPAGSMVGNVNLDMLPLQASIQPLREVVAFGAEHSSLGGSVERAARREGLKVVPDPMPEQRIFVRSDQYSFVRKGVPAVMLFGGGGPDASVSWRTAFDQWLKTVYHSVDDEVTQPLDYTGAVKLTRVSFGIAWEIADTAARPEWNRGDWFGETFGTRR